LQKACRIFICELNTKFQDFLYKSFGFFTWFCLQDTAYNQSLILIGLYECEVDYFTCSVTEFQFLDDVSSCSLQGWRSLHSSLLCPSVHHLPSLFTHLLLFYCRSRPACCRVLPISISSSDVSPRLYFFHAFTTGMLSMYLLTDFCRQASVIKQILFYSACITFGKSACTMYTQWFRSSSQMRL